MIEKTRRFRDGSQISAVGQMPKNRAIGFGEDSACGQADRIGLSKGAQVRRARDLAHP
jgi:hypothetical protein